MKNLEALACYDVESNGQFVAKCCPPWDTACVELLPGYYADGTKTYE